MRLLPSFRWDAVHRWALGVLAAARTLAVIAPATVAGLGTAVAAFTAAGAAVVTAATAAAAAELTAGAGNARTACFWRHERGVMHQAAVNQLRWERNHGHSEPLGPSAPPAVTATRKLLLGSMRVRADVLFDIHNPEHDPVEDRLEVAHGARLINADVRHARSHAAHARHCARCLLSEFLESDSTK